MDLVQTYTNQVTMDTSAAERLAHSEVLLRDVSRHMDRGIRYDGYIVEEIIRALLRVNLDTAHTTPELRDWLLSLGVTISRLTTGPEATSDILRGMTRAVSETGVGFDDILTWSAQLANNWFLRRDQTVTPTAPGFVQQLLTFICLCSDRQEDVCGNRNANISTADRRLLSLVARAIKAETIESINKVDCKYGVTALHHAAAYIRLPEVTRALVAYQHIDVNARTTQTYSTPLSLVIARSTTLHDSQLQLAQRLMAHSNINVRVLDKDHKAVLDYCLEHLRDSQESVTVALELIRLIGQHSTATPDMISSGLETLLGWEAPVSLQDRCQDVIVNLTANTNYNINRRLRDGKTVSHLAASQGHLDLVLRIIKTQGFDPKVQDELGNTILHYVCEKVTPQNQKRALEILNCAEVNWDYSLTNMVDQTILDYYQAVNNLRNPMVTGFLQKNNSGFSGVTWISFKPTSCLNVKYSTPEFTAEKASDRVYEMRQAYKGKAGIIAIHTFSDPEKNLPGYMQDTEDLAALWDGLGFEVVVPEGRNPDQVCLTAKDVEIAVKQFARQVLTRSDQCAVLCIMSHGGDGFLYGSDLHTVDTNNLIQELDNVNCIQMAGKPKIVILQACQGGTTDHGVHVRASPTPLARAAAGGWSETHLPSFSDIIFCTPSIRGCVSFVSNTSFYIRTLVKVFAEFAGKEEICALLTLVNLEVSQETVRAIKAGTTIVADHKQMPQFSSTLRKQLFFFPCPRGTDM